MSCSELGRVGGLGRGAGTLMEKLSGGGGPAADAFSGSDEQWTEPFATTFV